MNIHFKNEQITEGLSHVSDVAAIVHPKKYKCNGGNVGIYISGYCGETRNSLSLSSEKWCGSRHLVFWSLGTLLVSEIGYGDWLRKGKVLAPQIRPT